MNGQHLNETFGKVIKQLREERDLSQQELADYAELDRSYISDVERGRYNPTLLTIYKLSEILKIKPQELFKEVDKLLKAK
ncbi:MAG TPA: helix-turn-helix transcriptional regulator [Cyclobacteriaceae bacterium]|nr:helix-turn-helix transcriptional regulator [Cyclobacteriaceae bacterium]